MMPRLHGDWIDEAGPAPHDGYGPRPGRQRLSGASPPAMHVSDE